MNTARLRIVVDAGPGADDRERVEASRQLREMLLRQRVEQVVPARTETAPPGSKAGELVVAGTLVVTLVPAVISAVVATVQAWSERAAGRSASLVLGEDSLELTGLSAGQQQQLIDRFLEATAGGAEEAAADEPA
ncbi:hypothetical protein [Streptomyces capillispiralis]|uniref:Uncharacterized protein n=1 Tax=Streptomyces capillispiralis TaxID=68182 RepID=A0A561TQH8_9ACTN|nr:hypothetical protein [Streptomyces capillispiralis]TWF89364.1 hypothetical protein FHX78_116406 [Streptomyces capillispiralis]GHH93664.1 hypothetical protein GCM10017779_41210 [Streptomyces capillispiralis]